jgi:hypothetical protein
VQHLIVNLITALVLTACAQPLPQYQPYAGPVAPPQIAYRIDENRHFEVVPQEAGACTRANLYYVDKAQNIRSRVSVWRWGSMVDTTFVIDAANDQYLVAPIVVSSSGCQIGGGYQCSNRLYYSQDAGKSWKSTRSYRGSSTYLVGSTFYVHSREYGGWKVDINKNIPDDDKWHEYGSAEPQPQPVKMPLDTEFQCKPNGKE